MSRGLLIVLGAGALVLAVAAAARESPRPEAADLHGSAIRTPAPPPLTRATINRQDQIGSRHRRRESFVYDGRPLLSRLPIERRGVRIDISGLAPDDVTVVISIDPGRRSRSFARHLYRHVLAAADDPGARYAIRWKR